MNESARERFENLFPLDEPELGDDEIVKVNSNKFTGSFDLGMALNSEYPIVRAAARRAREARLGGAAPVVDESTSAA